MSCLFECRLTFAKRKLSVASRSQNYQRADGSVEIPAVTSQLRRAPRLLPPAAQVLGTSVDSRRSHKAFTEKYKLPFPLLADAGGAVAARYGALSDWLVIKLAKRYSFIVNPQGHVAKVYRSVDTSRHAVEILSDLQQLQLRARQP